MNDELIRKLVASLSSREDEITQLVGDKGICKAPQLAAYLTISLPTIRNRINNMKKKAEQNGLLPDWQNMIYYFTRYYSTIYRKLW